MPDSDAEPDSPSTFARLVRHHRLVLEVIPTTVAQRAADPDMPPLRGRVGEPAVGPKHEVLGHEPFALFDKLAAYVMANYELPAEPEPAVSVAEPDTIASVVATPTGLWDGGRLQAAARIRPAGYYDSAIDVGARPTLDHELDHVLSQMTTWAAVSPQHPARNDREAF